MTSSEQTPNPDESLNHQVDAICARFEDAWLSGSAPKIEDFLTELAGDTDTALLLELIVLDVHHRTKRGESPTPEEYAERFPEQATLIRDRLGVRLCGLKGLDQVSYGGNLDHGEVVFFRFVVASGNSSALF
jgi:hypothetical protein